MHDLGQVCMAFDKAAWHTTDHSMTLLYRRQLTEGGSTTQPGAGHVTLKQ